MIFVLVAEFALKSKISPSISACSHKRVCVCVKNYSWGTMCLIAMNNVLFIAIMNGNCKTMG